MVAKNRDKGSKPVPQPKAPVNQVEESRCPKCDSTEREDYEAKIEQEHAGEDANGKPYTHIIKRRTRCTTCGQTRVDRTFENRLPAMVEDQ